MKLNDLLHLVDDMELMEISILDSNGNATMTRKGRAMQFQTDKSLCDMEVETILQKIGSWQSNGVCNDEPFICVIIYNNEADFDKESTRK